MLIKIYRKQASNMANIVKNIFNSSVPEEIDTSKSNIVVTNFVKSPSSWFHEPSYSFNGFLDDAWIGPTPPPPVLFPLFAALAVPIWCGYPWCWCVFLSSIHFVCAFAWVTRFVCVCIPFPLHMFTLFMVCPTRPWSSHLISSHLIFFVRNALLLLLLFLFLFLFWKGEEEEEEEKRIRNHKMASAAKSQQMGNQGQHGLEFNALQDEKWKNINQKYKRKNTWQNWLLKGPRGRCLAAIIPGNSAAEQVITGGILNFL